MEVAQYNVMGTNYIQVFDDRLRRIVEECYEVAFIVCNSDMEEFTTAKIFDIFSQTFPTAYILNTGYWPFYSTTKGQCLCVCGRFAIPCRHTKSDFHWLDIAPIENDAAAVLFKPKLHGPIYPQEYQMDIQTVYHEGIHGCNINAIINVQYRRIEKGHRRQKMSKAAKELASTITQNDIYNRIFNITLFAGFLLRPEFYPAMFTIIFQPSPFFHDQYSTFFRNLKQLRSTEFISFHPEQKKIWYITCPMMATSTFVLQHVNVAFYKHPSQLMVYYPFYIKKMKTMKNKGCQTLDDAKRRIGEFSNIWSYNGHTSEQHPISTALVNLVSAGTNKAIESISQKPSIIEDSESFDNQWPVVGHSRVIQPHRSTIDSTSGSLQRQARGKRGHADSTRSCDVSSNPTSEPDSTTSVAHSRSSLPVSIPFNPDIESDISSLQTTSPQPSTSKMDFSKALKNSPSSPCPSDVAAEVVVKTEIDEEFNLIETVIWEDVMKKEEDWWEMDTATHSSEYNMY
ncbi:hypothetical protein JTB14_036866 [Gonioctena quinquepunctata]|nr:hypothetical protein JTB14_036866 [Gonioctena quinquepunctata]